MKGILLTIWQLPQIVVGLIVVAVVRPFAMRREGDIRYYYTDNIRGGVTLGNIVILNGEWYYDIKSEVHRHEAGHTKQSKILGWLYLPVVGLSSIIHAWLHNDKYGHAYRDFWTEKWADKLKKIIDYESISDYRKRSERSAEVDCH